MINDNIMVSIWCRTYNHRNYIKSALEGFVSQQTDFNYKVIIYDDASTDGTSDIIREYVTKYPQIFYAIIEEKNTFLCPDKRKKGLEIWHKYLTGKYIAFCEGDDYWIDCHKLQIQVDYLESHPECSLYLHNGLCIDCRDYSMKTMNPYDGDDEKELSPEEMIMLYKMHPPTASMLFKKELIEAPAFIFETSASDYSIQLYALAKGNVHYSSRIMSVYRLYSSGSYTERMTVNKEHLFSFRLGVICFLLQYDKYTNYEYHIWIVNRVHAYITGIVHSIEFNTSLNEYYNICKERGYFFSSICEKCLEKIELLRCQTLDRSYCSDEVKKYVGKYKNIIIMGIGKYSSIVTEQFENNGIEFVGYAVSRKNEGEGIHKGKPVWTLSELPFDKENTGIIVAINPEHWDDILASIKVSGIEHYYCPFLLEAVGGEKI